MHCRKPYCIFRIIIKNKINAQYIVVLISKHNLTLLTYKNKTLGIHVQHEISAISSPLALGILFHNRAIPYLCSSKSISSTMNLCESCYLSVSACSTCSLFMLLWWTGPAEARGCREGLDHKPHLPNMLNLALFKSSFCTFHTSGCPLHSPLSRDIMPSEEDHLVFVTQRKHTHTHLSADIAVTWGHDSNRAASVSFKLCLQFNDLFVFVVCGECLLSLSLSLSLCVSRSLTCSDSERSMPIGYTGGTEWCKGGGGVVMVTCSAHWRRRMLYVPNTKARTWTGSKDLRAWLARRKCAERGPDWTPERCFNWLGLYWPGKWQGWDSANRATEADLHVRDWQRGLETVSSEQLCYVCEAAFCWAWLHINKRGITKVCRLFLGRSPAERRVRGSLPPPLVLPSFASFSYSPQYAPHVHPIQKKNTHLPFLLSFSVPFLSPLPTSP